MNPPANTEVLNPDLDRQNSPAAADRRVTDAVASERKRLNAIHALRHRHDPDHTRISEARFSRFIDDSSKSERDFCQFLVTQGLTVGLNPTPARDSSVISEDKNRFDSMTALRGQFAARGVSITEEEFDGFVDDQAKTVVNFRDYLQEQSAEPNRRLATAR